MQVPNFFMAQPLNFEPITNVLTGWRDQQNKNRQFDIKRQQMAEQVRQFGLTNALAQGQFGIAREAANRAAEADAREREKAAALRQYLSAGPFDGVPQPLVGIAQASNDADPIKDFLLTRAKAALKQGEYNKNPVYGTRVGPDGRPETVMLQTGSQGDAVATRLPEGVTVNAQKPIEIDAGTHVVILDPITRQPIANIPKNVAEAAAQREIGQGRGQALVNLPQAESNARNLTEYIDAVANDKNLDRMIGYSALLPNVSTGARSLQSRINQLNDQAFTIAFESLKGGGAITEQEGRAATQSLSRLREQIQSGKDYREALRDFRNEVSRLLEVARRKAGFGGPNGNAGFAGPQGAPGPRRQRYNPATGEIE